MKNRLIITLLMAVSLVSCGEVSSSKKEDVTSSETSFDASYVNSNDPNNVFRKLSREEADTEFNNRHFDNIESNKAHIVSCRSLTSDSSPAMDYEQVNTWDIDLDAKYSKYRVDGAYGVPKYDDQGFIDHVVMNQYMSENIDYLDGHYYVYSRSSGGDRTIKYIDYKDEESAIKAYDSSAGYQATYDFDVVTWNCVAYAQQYFEELLRFAYLHVNGELFHHSRYAMEENFEISDTCLRGSIRIYDFTFETDYEQSLEFNYVFGKSESYSYHYQNGLAMEINDYYEDATITFGDCDMEKLEVNYDEA